MIFEPNAPAPVYAPERPLDTPARDDIRHAVGNITLRQRRIDGEALAQVERAARETTYRTPRLMLPGNGK